MVNAKLEIELVTGWEDDTRIRVSSSNTYFSGQAICYTTRGELTQIASKLTRFPLTPDQTLSFGTEQRNDLSYFKCSFEPSNYTGHYMATIEIVQIGNYSNVACKNNDVSLQFLIEPGFVDVFASSLRLLAEGAEREVTAVLKGICELE